MKKFKLLFKPKLNINKKHELNENTYLSNSEVTYILDYDKEDIKSIIQFISFVLLFLIFLFTIIYYFFFY